MKVEKTHDKLDALLRSLEKVQAAVDVNTRAVERLDDRVRALEMKPSLDTCKAEILSSVTSSLNATGENDMLNAQRSVAVILLCEIRKDTCRCWKMACASFSQLVQYCSLNKMEGAKREERRLLRGALLTRVHVCVFVFVTCSILHSPYRTEAGCGVYARRLANALCQRLYGWIGVCLMCLLPALRKVRYLLKTQKEA